MKKLMIAAAAVAMIGSAFADAQVYEYKLSLKSTTCKEAKVANGYLTKIGLMEPGDELVYRTPASLTLVGLTWGCECNEAIAGTWGQTKNNPNNWYGITFWNPKANGKLGSFLGGVYNGTEFQWDMLNRIGKKADEVELSFDLIPSADALDGNFELKLAGLGKIKDQFAYDSEDEEWTDCNSYIKSVKGSVAGYVNPEAGIVVCNYCEEYDVFCNVYQFCICGDDNTDETRTVAYGTFTMKYNASASKKLKNSARIAGAYNFPKAIKAALVLADE